MGLLIRFHSTKTVAALSSLANQRDGSAHWLHLFRIKKKKERRRRDEEQTNQ